MSIDDIFICASKFRLYNLGKTFNWDLEMNSSKQRVQALLGGGGLFKHSLQIALVMNIEQDKLFK